MNFSNLPTSGLEFIEWKWEQIKPYFDDLTVRPLDATTVDDWLADWSRLMELVEEAGFRLYVATTQNTTDEEVEQRYMCFNDTIRPRAASAEQVLKDRLLASKLEPQGFEVPLAKIRLQSEIYSEANLPLLSEDLRLVMEYAKVRGAEAIEWDGQTLTTIQLMPYLEEHDRSIREKAWRLRMSRWLADRAAFDEIWLKLLKLRAQIAKNAGEPDYRTYRWKQLLRMDYTPDDTRQFHDAIEQVVVPAATRLYEKRRQKLGVDILRPWDLGADPFNTHSLRPYKTVEELKDRITSVFRNVDPDLACHFEIMREEGLLDIEARPNKAPSGYSQPFEAVKRPFIFFSCGGIHYDVEMMLHEGGHAFHTFESAHLPYLALRGDMGISMEIAEVASYGMEMLAMRYLGKDSGGFYTEEELARATYRKLEDLVLFWPYMSAIDTFQYWAYTHIDEAMDIATWDSVWAELWERFMPGVDYSGEGVEEFIPMRWRIQGHVFDSPLYFVEYGIAQLGAVQIWANALKDQRAAVAQYRAALQLGGSRRLPDLYRAAGAKWAFDADTLKQAIDLIEDQMAKIEARL